MSDDDNWTRPPPRTPRPPEPPGVVTIFTGYSAALVAEWCGISLATARLYKAGKRKPSKAVVKLFVLHRDRRVLGPEWHGWLVKADSIVDPEGNETTRPLLHNYQFIMQFARQSAAELGEQRRQEFDELLVGPSDEWERLLAGVRRSGTPVGS